MGGEQRSWASGGRAVALLVAALALVACDDASDSNRRAKPTEDDAGGEPGTYINPVYAQDCPDPGVSAVGSDKRTYYMVCTGFTFPIRKSLDLVHWTETGKAILADGAPTWAANTGRNWAPEIHAVGKRFVAYFTTVNGANVLSIGTAWADDPEGPYTVSAGPLLENGFGVIDAHYFHDEDDRSYLFFKVDGNAIGVVTPMYVQELTADGLSFAPGSMAVQVLINDTATWEGGVVEAPWVIHRGEYYYMFYSGNVYDSRYRTGVARSKAVTGPYEKLGDPVLTNNARWVGPGHGSVVNIDGTDYFLYHAWPALPGGGNDKDKGRQVLLDRISWVSDWPVIGTGSPSDTRLAIP